MLNSKPQPPESLLDVIRVIFQWRKFIILFTVACTVVAIGGSMMMSNYYKCTTKFYTANDEAFSRGALYGQGQSGSEIGNVDMAERVINFASSRDLADHMIRKFDLFKHYDIDSTTAKGKDKVRKRFFSLYEVTKDEYGAVSVSIEDKDKSLPLPMVVEIVAHIDLLYQKAIRANRERTLKAYEGTLTERQNKLTSISDTLQVLRQKYGIFDVYSQGEILSQIVLQTESSLTEEKATLDELRKSPSVDPDTIILLNAKVKGLEKKLASLTNNNVEGNGQFSVSNYYIGRNLVKYYEDMQNNITLELQGLSEKYSQFKTAVALTPSVVIPAESPQAPLVKSRPKRSIIVLGAVLAGFIFAAMCALLMDTYRRVDWRGVINSKD